MDKKDFQNMLSNSIWMSSEKNTSYQFTNGNFLSINGKDHTPYSINSHSNKVELLIDSITSYNIEYIDDFTLKLFNKIESFIIMPE